MSQPNPLAVTIGKTRASFLLKRFSKYRFHITVTLQEVDVRDTRIGDKKHGFTIMPQPKANATQPF